MNTNTANNNKILQTLLEGAFGENNATSLCLCDLWRKLPEIECIARNAEGQ